MSGAVGVVLSTYRRPQHLKSALDSVAAQTRPPACIIVCDDESGGDTPGVVSQFAHVSPIPVQWLSAPHTGHPGKNRNQALTHLVGLDWVAFLDDDDRWESDKLSVQMARLAENPVDLLGCGITAVGPDDSVRRTYRPAAGPVTLRELAVQNPFATSGVILRRELWQELGGFDEHPRMVGWGDDYALWLLAAARGARLANVPDPLVVYREGQGIMAAVGRDMDQRAFALGRMARALPGSARTARRILWGRHHAAAAEAALAAGRRGESWRHAVRAVWHFPARPTWATLAHVAKGRGG